jgi:DtxR family Mn-dependent transcriptional regulator
MYSFTEENYLKAIYKLSNNHGNGVSTNSIAENMETKAASVTDMIKKLSDKKLLKYEKYKGVNLTQKGKDVALQTIRKHRIWEVFLHEKLKFGWEEVHEVAEQLEHIQSELLINKLDEFLGYPTHDPHGDPIPGENGEFHSNAFVSLDTVDANKKVILSGVINHSVPFLQHLKKIDLTLGQKLIVIEINEYDRSLKLLLNGKMEIFISNEVAKNILVK